MATKDDINRFLGNLRNEREGAAIYRAMAQAEKQPQLSQVYDRLAAVEEKHAHFWEEQLKTAGASLPQWRPSIRIKIMSWVARRLGAHYVAPIVASAEQASRGVYDTQSESQGTSMPSEERSHARLLNTLVANAGAHPHQIEGRHRNIGGNALRAAVLGANDGLVSNLSLVMGVAGAAMTGRSILVTGLAGVLAGACSMAIGEWISVQSSRELNQRQLQIEADELAVAPQEEEEELALIYQAKGLNATQAKSIAATLMADKTKALDALAREELGIDPHDLGGSPWEAAWASFLLFAVGAFIPVAPYFFTAGRTAVLYSLAFSVIALFVIGAGITLVTGRPLVRSGIRQIVFGLVAAAITFGIGHLIGVSISG